MIENTKRNVSLIGAGAALVLCLAGGTAAGVVPRIGSAGEAASTSSSEASTVALPETAAAAVVEAPVVEPPPPTAPPATAAPVTSPPTTRAPAARRTTASTAPVAAGPAAGAPASPAASTAVGRLTPSSAQVAAASARLGLPIAPSEAQARQFGDSVCDAFDQGQTFSQVMASARQAASQIPLIVVPVATIDASVRSAVSLFCPGHSSKLG